MARSKSRKPKSQSQSKKSDSKRIPKKNRKVSSGSKSWGAYLDPDLAGKKKHGTGKQADYARVWFVSSTAIQGSAKHQKVRVTAKTPLAAARFVLKKDAKLSNPWETDRAYVTDGKGTGVALSFIRELNEKTKRMVIKPVHQTKPLRPTEVSEELSSESGSEDYAYIGHRSKSRPKSKSKRSGSQKKIVDGKHRIQMKDVKIVASLIAKLVRNSASEGSKQAAGSVVRNAALKYLPGQYISKPAKASEIVLMKREIGRLAEQGAAREGLNGPDTRLVVAAAKGIVADNLIDFYHEQ